MNAAVRLARGQRFLPASRYLIIVAVVGSLLLAMTLIIYGGDAHPKTRVEYPAVRH